MKHDKMHAKAIERYTDAIDYDRDNREEAADDLAFIVGEQWPDTVKTARESEDRPCITVNRLPQFLRQVTGDIRRTNPALSIIAGDNPATEETAEIVDGLVRQIQYACDAASVYERAAEQAAACGMGWFRILTEYESDDSLDQVIRVESIVNPFAVHVDPDAKDPTRRDAEYMFVMERVPREVFKERYPKANDVEFPADGSAPYLRHWIDRDTVAVAEYWWKEPYKKTIAKLADGSTQEVEAGTKPDGAMVLAVREVEAKRVMTCTMSGKEVLDGPTEWPGRDIPIIGVMGEELHIGDRVVRSSVIRYAKDPQRLYNYARSQQAEVISLQPKAPFIGTTEQFAGLEAQWKQANTASLPYLAYNADQDAPGPPQRSTPPVASQGLASEIMLAADDMQATTGIYDAALGQRSNEKSGVAIERRQMESDISTSIYVDNLAKALWQAGRIMVDLIPVIYDAARVVRIVGADESEKSVPINGVAVMNGEQVPVNDLTIGRYDVRVKTGPSYTTQREQAADAMTSFIQAVPAAGAVIGDLIAKTQDWPGADEVAERLKKMLPPGMANDEPTPEEMQAQQQMQAMQQQMQAMQQQLAEIELRTKAAEAAEAEADAVKAQADAMKARAEASGAARAEALDGAAVDAAFQGIRQQVGPY